MAGIEKFDTGLLAGERLSLELDSESELHLTRVIGLTRQRAERCRIAEIKMRSLWVRKLVVVQNIGKDRLNFGADALRNSHVLPQAQIHVPVWQATQNAEAAILVI